MPRAVQINTSQNNTNEDEGSEAYNTNTNTTRRSNGVHDERESTPASIAYDKTSLHDRSSDIENDEDPYILRCVVGGKLKLFKKDSRVWLHKSSGKGKRKPDEREQCCGDVVPVKIVKFDDDKYTDEPISIELRENSSVGRSDVKQSSGNYNLYRHSDTDVSSDLSSLGDSDADLTYSEATTPNKTPSYSEEGQTTGVSGSGNSIETLSTRDTNRLADFDDANLTDRVKRNSDSLGYLDICNESSNNVASFPTNRDISRKIAPAIDIEEESVRESLLDCAVNRGHEDQTELHRVAYFTRSASKGKNGKHVKFKKEMKAKNKISKSKPVGTRSIRYNLRGTQKSNAAPTINRQNIVETLNTNTKDQLCEEVTLDPTVTNLSSFRKTSKVRKQINAVDPTGESDIATSIGSYRSHSSSDAVGCSKLKDTPSGHPRTLQSVSTCTASRYSGSKSKHSCSSIGCSGSSSGYASSSSGYASSSRYASSTPGYVSSSYGYSNVTAGGSQDHPFEDDIVSLLYLATMAVLKTGHLPYRTRK